MIIFPPQEFITWTNTLVQFPWPIQLNDFPLRRQAELEARSAINQIQRA